MRSYHGLLLCLCVLVTHLTPRSKIGVVYVVVDLLSLSVFVGLITGHRCRCAAQVVTLVVVAMVFALTSTSRQQQASREGSCECRRTGEPRAVAVECQAVNHGGKRVPVAQRQSIFRCEGAVQPPRWHAACTGFQCPWLNLEAAEEPSSVASC